MNTETIQKKNDILNQELNDEWTIEYGLIGLYIKFDVTTDHVI